MRQAIELAEACVINHLPPWSPAPVFTACDDILVRIAVLEKSLITFVSVSVPC